MEQVDPLKTEFEVMCFVKDQRAVKGTCTKDEVSRKFGEEEVRQLIQRGLLAETTFGMLDWTLEGKRAMGPEAVRRHISKQVLREKGRI